VALALVPEAVAFSIIAGLSTLIGLYAAFVMGLVTSLLGANLYERITKLLARRGVEVDETE
jgi:MFS superfamily sulfate permease-like transporter